MSSIVPFDSGTSYVVRELPAPVEKYRFVDKFERTASDRKYLEDYEIIFFAAESGDTKGYQEVIDRGFRDFDAQSFGMYGTSSGISPRKIAEIKQQTQVLKLFDLFSSKVSATVHIDNSADSKPNSTSSQLTPEEKIEYDNFMEFVKSMPSEDMKEIIKSALVSSYTFDEMLVSVSTLSQLKTEVQLKAFLRKRIEQPFAETKLLERPHLIALRDFLDTKIINV